MPSKTSSTSTKRTPLELTSSECIAVLDNRLPAGFAPGLAELARSCYLTLIWQAISRPQAADMAVHLARGIGTDIGGRSFYIPKGTGAETAKVAAAITREFNGRNTAELAVKYRLTQMRVYQILKAARVLRRGS